MTEYIKREDVLALSHYDDHDCEIVDVEDVEKLPSADVVERKTGEWEKHNDGIMFWWECSECHQDPWYDREELYDYCPSCGAKMEFWESIDAEVETNK